MANLSPGTDWTPNRWRLEEHAQGVCDPGCPHCATDRLRARAPEMTLEEAEQVLANFRTAFPAIGSLPSAAMMGYCERDVDVMLALRRQKQPERPKKSWKKAVQAHGEFVLDYVESRANKGRPCWFVGRGRVAGNTSPIPSGLHKAPHQAWRAAAIALGIKEPADA